MLARLIYLGLLILPMSVHAGLSISEVAWMGSLTSANHEWIELYNDGATSVEVDGWVLKDNLSLTIPLAGTVPAGSYIVLERTSDASSPASAFLIYTGALVNTGATLTLLDSAGGIVDQVVGGEGWSEIGGNNETKETAQYTSTGWKTGSPTPGAENVTTSSPPGGDEGDDAPPASSSPPYVPARSSGTSKKDISLKESEAIPLVTIEGPHVVYVNQEIPFSIGVRNVGRTIAHSFVHTWNFGDTTTASGTDVVHRYHYPGTYLLTVRSRFGKHNVLSEQEIKVLPVTFSLQRNRDGVLMVSNDAGYVVDISGFTLRSTKDHFVFPQDSLIKAKATVPIPRTTFTTTALDTIGLYDTKGINVARLFSKSDTTDMADVHPKTYTRSQAPTRHDETQQKVFATLQEKIVVSTSSQSVTEPEMTVYQEQATTAFDTKTKSQQYERGVVTVFIFLLLGVLWSIYRYAPQRDDTKPLL